MSGRRPPRPAYSRNSRGLRPAVPPVLRRRLPAGCRGCGPRTRGIAAAGNTGRRYSAYSPGDRMEPDRRAGASPRLVRVFGAKAGCRRGRRMSIGCGSALRWGGLLGAVAEINLLQAVKLAFHQNFALALRVPKNCSTTKYGRYQQTCHSVAPPALYLVVVKIRTGFGFFGFSGTLVGAFTSMRGGGRGRAC